MKIVNGFTVPAPPEEVFAFLLDVNKVVRCVPGAELTEAVDSSTFHGKLTVKAGAVTIKYQGTAEIVNTEESEGRAVVTVTAKGREVAGSGQVYATVVMTVAEVGGATEVTIDTDVNIAGKLAQFGRGTVEDLAKKMIGDMARCIQANISPGA